MNIVLIGKMEMRKMCENISRFIVCLDVHENVIDIRMLHDFCNTFSEFKHLITSKRIKLNYRSFSSLNIKVEK